MTKKSYCTQNDGDCLTCPLISYGRDCQNVLLGEDTADAEYQVEARRLDALIDSVTGTL
jgi:hypothetical protein